MRNWEIDSLHLTDFIWELEQIMVFMISVFSHMWGGCWIRSGPFNFSTTVILAGMHFRYWGASLTTIQWMPVLPSNPIWALDMFSDTAKCPLGAKISPAENHWITLGAINAIKDQAVIQIRGTEPMKEKQIQDQIFSPKRMTLFFCRKLS